MEDPQMISMDFSTNGRSDCYFRISASREVKYITIKAGALDAESLDDMPLDFENILPPLPYYEGGWKTATIFLNASSQQLEASLSSAKLPSVDTLWHHQSVDMLDLERTEPLALLTQECKWKNDSGSERMIAKMARFHWEVQYMEAETRMYQALEKHGVSPRFLGHIREGDRTIGFVLEKIPDGRHAEPADLDICQKALGRFHALGFIHGDCNKYNFVIRPDNRVTLIDFSESKRCYDTALLKREMNTLEEELAEQTGRGGGYRAAYEEVEEGESDNVLP